MWFEDNSKYKNLNDAILRVVQGQPEEQPEATTTVEVPETRPETNEKQEVLSEKDISIDDAIKVVNEAKRKSKHDYQIYHDTYSSAVQHAVDHTKKVHGFDVDQDSYDSEVTFGQRKPSAGKTVMKKIDLHKDGKSARKRLQIQVHGMSNGKYELNKYVEDFDPNPFHKTDGIVEASKGVLKEANIANQGAANIKQFAQQLKIPVTDVVHWDHGQGRVEYIISLKGGSQLEYTNWDDTMKIPKAANPNMKVMRQYLANKKSIEGTKTKVADVKLGKYYLIKGLKAGLSMLGK